MSQPLNRFVRRDYQAQSLKLAGISQERLRVSQIEGQIERREVPSDQSSEKTTDLVAKRHGYSNQPDLVGSIATLRARPQAGRLIRVKCDGFRIGYPDADRDHTI
jgi:hypothetical protein